MTSYSTVNPLASPGALLLEQQRKYRDEALGLDLTEEAATVPLVRRHSVFSAATNQGGSTDNYIDAGKRRGRPAFIGLASAEVKPLTSNFVGYGAIDEHGSGDDNDGRDDAALAQGQVGLESLPKFANFVAQIPAISVVSLLILMAAIPFGVAYFPIGWTTSAGLMDISLSSNDTDGIQDKGVFPLPGKEALGIRMCLFATIMGQVAITFTSNFDNAIVFQLIENVPFYHALAHIVFKEQGYGIEALSTLFFLLGFGSVLVGVIFFVLGKWELGRIVYFFPSHVLVGCIGGIGVFIAVTSISVTNNVEFTFDLEGAKGFVDNLNLFGVVIFFEAAVRLLDWALSDEKGNSRFPLLAPLFFCSIVPIFYLTLSVLGVSVARAKDMGYFLPDSSAGACVSGQVCAEPALMDRIFDGHVLDIFRIMDIRLVSWTAVVKSLGTLIAMAAFSLIQVPIMIPALAVSTNQDMDMNVELISHGYMNLAAGVFGGIQSVMTYSFSFMYHTSGGKGKVSSLAVAAVTGVLFIVGPSLSAYIPRCMAGTLLLHIGIDLFLEGVYDSYANYDYLEYAGIWLIVLVMNLLGMTAALLAGIVAALSAYAVQSITHLDPIFRIMLATTLRSSAWSRSTEATAVLDDNHTGRSRILVVQLQGHLFFGNIAAVSDAVKKSLSQRQSADDEPVIVILDFTLVVGMDSSAAHAVAKLKDAMHKYYSVEVTVFTTGSHRDSFPCEFALTEALSAKENQNETTVDFNDVASDSNVPAQARRVSIMISPESKSIPASMALRSFPKNRVCDSLDDGLIFAEDMLIARENPALLEKERPSLIDPLDYEDENLTIDEEKKAALQYLQNITPNHDGIETKRAIAFLFSNFTREEFSENDIVWKQGSESDCAKLVVCGTFMAYLEGTDICENVTIGAMFGELGLVEGTRRLSTVECLSDAVVYTLSREAWDKVTKANPRAARLLDRIVIRNLAQRVQHVSNRIFETRCLPI